MTEPLAEISSNDAATRTGSGFTRYRLDAKDRIVDVGGDWDSFAMDNGAEGLVSSVVVGTLLRSYIAGDVTRMFVDALLARVRLSGRPAMIPYRCDSPGIKRCMEMSLAKIGSDLVSEHRIVSERVMFPLLSFVAVEDKRPGDWVRRCSMCNRLTLRNGENCEPDAFAPAPGEALRVIYHVCADCQRRVQERLGP